MSNLYILKEAITKLYKDYTTLLIEYPEVDLGIKGQRIEQIINRAMKPRVYLPGNRKLIMESLKKKEYTIEQLSKEFNMTRQGVKHHLKNLLLTKKIMIVGKGKYACDI